MGIRKFDRPLKKNYLFLTACLFAISCLVQGNLTFTMFVGVLLFAVGFIMRMRTSPYISFMPSLFQGWFLCVWALIAFNGFFMTSGYFGWRTILINLLPFFAVMFYYEPFRNKELLFEIFCKGCIGGNIVTIAYIVVNELPLILAGGYRIGQSASGNVNTVAMNLCMFSAVIYYCIVFLEQKNLIPQFIISMLLILMTGSKKGLVGIVIVVLVLSLFKYKGKLYRYVIPVAVIAVILYILKDNAYFYNILGRRIDAFFDSLESNQEYGSTGERIGMYEVGWNYFRQSPWIGNGYGYFALHSKWKTYSHNNFIEMLASFGLIGTVLYYSLFVSLLKTGLNKMREDHRVVLFLMLIILQILFDFASVNFYNNSLMYIVLFFSCKIMLS